MPQTVTNRVARLRGERGWTLLELSRRTPKSIKKVDPSAISRIERGLHEPGVIVKAALARAFGLEVDDVFPPQSEEAAS